ncbi:MAG: low molecular weight protein-tyrosine-phosphatase [Pseudomonadota bacterium]
MADTHRAASVLFVCMGNICRSPTAQGVFESVVHAQAPDLAVELDSAGTHAYHVGQPPDRRSQAAALARGYDLSAQRARQVAVDDFYRYSWILAMDRDNLSALTAMEPSDGTAEVGLFLRFAANADVVEVPDPYYGDGLGFERVLDLVEDAAHGLLAHVREQAGGHPR